MTDTAIRGRDRLVAKVSAVDATGALRQPRIDGLLVRYVRPVPHEDGVLAEIAREGWPEISVPVVQVHLTTTLPGRTRAWGLHQFSTDRLFVVSGLVSIVVFDGRIGSPTEGVVNEFKVSERNPALVVIPPNLYHGWKNIGTSDASIINMPTSVYRYDAPDALDLDYQSDAAARIVPFRW